jgi:hypothetical protein
MVSHPKVLLTQSLKNTEPHLTNLWKESANKFGWNAQDASMVKVNVGEHGVALEHHPDAAQKIFDIEYGYKQETPKPAMREFTELSKPHIASAIRSALFEHVKEHL